jgi:hypothetical protein
MNTFTRSARKSGGRLRKRDQIVALAGMGVGNLGGRFEKKSHSYDRGGGNRRRGLR